MPIFQDDLGGGRDAPPTTPKLSPPLESQSDRSTITRKISEESIRTELCEGLLLDYPENNVGNSSGEPQSGVAFPIDGTSDRIELIQRLKKGQSPTWLSNRNVSHAKGAITILAKTKLLYSSNLSFTIAIQRHLRSPRPMPRTRQHCFPPPKYQNQECPQL